MDRIVVGPSGPLEGTVRVSGAKNSVLKLMAATVLAEGTFVLRNVPAIEDVTCMADLLRSMGCLLYTSPSPRDRQKSRMPSSA